MTDSDQLPKAIEDYCFSTDPHARVFQLLVESRANFTYHVVMSALVPEDQPKRGPLFERYSRHAIAFERMDRSGDVSGFGEEFARYQETAAIEAEFEPTPDPEMWQRAQQSALKHFGARMVTLEQLQSERAELQRLSAEQHPDLNELLGQIDEVCRHLKPAAPEPEYVVVTLRPGAPTGAQVS